MTLFDTHTHSLRPDAWVNRSPADILDPGFAYSMGVHPWNAADFSLTELREAARSPLVEAIGETGLDKLKGPSMECQEAAFRGHIATSEEFRKPLIIHCVKAFDRLLALKKELKPQQRWIVHGFRGKPQLAAQLLAAGIDLSLGPAFNPFTAAIIPADRLHIETDDTDTPIAEVAAAVDKARQQS